MEVQSIVLPVFGVVLVGYLYARRHAPDMGAANRVNLEVFVPALIFHVTSAKDFRISDFLALAVGGVLVVLVVLGSGLAGLAAARLLRIDWRSISYLPKNTSRNLRRSPQS
jgi:malate permease and related proteins